MSVRGLVLRIEIADARSVGLADVDALHLEGIEQDLTGKGLRLRALPSVVVDLELDVVVEIPFGALDDRLQLVPARLPLGVVELLVQHPVDGPRLERVRQHLNQDQRELEDHHPAARAAAFFGSASRRPCLGSMHPLAAYLGRVQRLRGRRSRRARRSGGGPTSGFGRARAGAAWWWRRRATSPSGRRRSSPWPPPATGPRTAAFGSWSASAGRADGPADGDFDRREAKQPPADPVVLRAGDGRDRVGLRRDPNA